MVPDLRCGFRLIRLLGRLLPLLSVRRPLCDPLGMVPDLRCGFIVKFRLLRKGNMQLRNVQYLQCDTIYEPGYFQNLHQIFRSCMFPCPSPSQQSLATCDRHRNEQKIARFRTHYFRDVICIREYSNLAKFNTFLLNHLWEIGPLENDLK